MKRIVVLAVPFALLIAAVAPATPANGTAQKWFEKAVKKVEGTFTPAEAKAGQTVTFTLTVELHEGFHTYPTVQKDKLAAGMVNIIKFPEAGAVIFVGKVMDPKDPKTKTELEAGIQELRYYDGKVVFTRKAVVSPKAKPGPTAVKLTNFKLSVCDKDVCYPPKDVPIEATLKVLEGAVPVEPDYADEVKQALGEK